MSGGVVNLANSFVKFDSNGYIQVTIGGGTIAALNVTALNADTLTLNLANDDIVLWRQAAKTLQIDADGAGAALTLLTVKGPITSTGVFTGTTQALSGKTSTYNGVVTAGQGVPSIYAAGSVAAQTTVAATICTYTTPAADGDYEVSGNVNVTASGTHSFSLNCAYTDEGGSARTLIMPVAQLAGAFVASGLITNVTGAGPYESAAMHIRCKQTTAITIGLSAGTFTSVTYNARAAIRQLQ